MILGITGAEGFIGWHIRAYCYAHHPEITLKLANRSTFSDAAALQSFAEGCDVIVHAAGVNRGTDAEVAEGNIALAEALAKACSNNAAFPYLVYLNSLHKHAGNVYGNAKRHAAEILMQAAANRRTTFTDIVLPHVFGEFCKPFYNSVVATFCHQLANGETPTIHTDGTLQLLHVQQVASAVLAAVNNATSGEVALSGTDMKVSALLTLLQEMHQRYAEELLIPNLSDPLTLALFNTLRAYRFPASAAVPLTLKSDARGHLFEAVKTLQGGQTFLSTTHPGITRGNHYHTRKVERFLVCSGKAEIAIRKLFSGDVIRFQVRGDTPTYIDMPTFHTHRITNIGDSELVTLFWAHELFDPANPDTFSEMVEL